MLCIHSKFFTCSVSSCRNNISDCCKAMDKKKLCVCLFLVYVFLPVSQEYCFSLCFVAVCKFKVEYFFKKKQCYSFYSHLSVCRFSESRYYNYG